MTLQTIHDILVSPSIVYLYVTGHFWNSVLYFFEWRSYQLPWLFTVFLKTICVCTHLTDVSSSTQRRSPGLLTKETSNRPRALLEMFLCAARSRLPEVNFNNSSFCQVRGALMESIWCFQHCLPPCQIEWRVCQLHSAIHQKSCQVCHPLRYPLEGAASHCNRMN